MGRMIAGMGLVGMIVFAIALMVLWPLVVIWAVNTLFALGIAYTFYTWLAVLVLTVTFGKGNVNSK